MHVGQLARRIVALDNDDEIRSILLDLKLEDMDARRISLPRLQHTLQNTNYGLLVKTEQRVMNLLKNT